MTDALPPEPRMLPLRVRVSPQSDETVVLRPADDGYLAEYRMAAYDYRRFGRPMPYAGEEREVSMLRPNGQAPGPSRRPLRVLMQDVEVIVRPGDSTYDYEYEVALHAFHTEGIPMPYAEEQGTGKDGE